MQLTHRFSVPAPIDVAWAAFNDLERIVPCFPGAELTSFDGENFEGLCKVKLGPISLQYTGKGRFVERNEATRHAVIEAKGKDRRGNGTAAASVKAQLEAEGDNVTGVEVVTDLAITGRPAQFGRGVMQGVSDKLLAQFASCLETRLGGPAPVAEDVPDTAVTPASAAEIASAGPDGAEPTGTPIADQAEKAVKAKEAAATSRPRHVAAPAPSELDLGATVLPVLLKRYAVQTAVVVFLLLVLNRLRRRTR